MARSPRLPRRSPLPRQDLSPHDIFSLGVGGDPDPDWPRTIVVDDQRPAELLIGRARLERHLRLMPDRTIAAFRVSPSTDDQREAISALDGWKTLLAFGAGISALHESGMPLSQIKDSVRSAGHISDLGRLISVFRENPDLFDLAERSRGKLKMGHLQALARAEPARRDGLAREAIARRWSVHQLLAQISTPREEIDADVRALARELGLALGTEVEINGTGEVGEVRLAWHTAEELQGLFQRLSRSGMGAPPLPYPTAGLGARGHAKRWLQLSYVSSIEFEDLFSHLLGRDSGFGAHGVQS